MPLSCSRGELSEVKGGRGRGREEGKRGRDGAERLSQERVREKGVSRGFWNILSHT